MKKIALDILEKLPQNSVVLPVQVLGELFQVLVRKGGRTPRQARNAVLGWRDAYSLVETSAAVLVAAADLACSSSDLDAVILSAAPNQVAGCCSPKTCRMGLSGRRHGGEPVWEGAAFAARGVAGRVISCHDQLSE